jgi:biotin-(acetyl-CoA carboxylase) ligase
MNAPLRRPPRFVPTLTEVIEPPAFKQTATNPDLDEEALVATILQQVQPMVAQWLQQESEQWLRATLAQQLREFNSRMQSELESLVRQAISEALTPQNRPETNSAPTNY